MNRKLDFSANVRLVLRTTFPYFQGINISLLLIPQQWMEKCDDEVWIDDLRCRVQQRIQKLLNVRQALVCDGLYIGSPDWDARWQAGDWKKWKYRSKKWPLMRTCEVSPKGTASTTFDAVHRTPCKFGTEKPDPVGSVWTPLRCRCNIFPSHTASGSRERWRLWLHRLVPHLNGSFSQKMLKGH